MAQSSSPGDRSAIVIGAGIVGTCTAMYLQREGFKVTLVERNAPGDGCSHGNAGNLGIASCVPYSLPGMVWKVPRLLLDPTSPLAVAPSHFLKATPWFLRFLREGTHERVERIADALRSLMSRLYDAYAPLLADAGAKDMVQNAGRLQVHESERTFKGGEYGMDIRRRRGIEVRTLTGDEVREMEPALGPSIYGGYFIPEASHCVNPSRLIKKFADCFVAKGGTLFKADAIGFDLAAGPGVLVTDRGRLRASAVVIAAGAWSTRFAEQLGVRVPLEAERGYHAMLPRHGTGLKIPVTASDRYITITPMENGLRISGMGEFAPVDAPPRFRYVQMMVDHSKTLLPKLDDTDSYPWMGPRPATPDGKAIIDRCRNHPWAYLAFGHGHVGLGTGAITGRIVSQMVAGKVPEVDLTPFRADRF